MGVSSTATSTAISTGTRTGPGTMPGDLSTDNTTLPPLTSLTDEALFGKLNEAAVAGDRVRVQFVRDEARDRGFILTGDDAATGDTVIHHIEGGGRVQYASSRSVEVRWDATGWVEVLGPARLKNGDLRHNDLSPDRLD